jgi:sulfite exporter TauE/SafE
MLDHIFKAVESLIALTYIIIGIRYYAIRSEVKLPKLTQRDLTKFIVAIFLIFAVLSLLNHYDFLFEGEKISKFSSAFNAILMAYFSYRINKDTKLLKVKK